MERHRYVVLLDALQKPSDTQYNASKAELTLATLDANIAAAPVHNGTTIQFPKSKWTGSWIKAVTLTNQLNGSADDGGVYLLVRK